MSRMFSWSNLVESYLVYRQRLGYSREGYGFYLPKFARFAEKRHAKHLTTQLAMDWACASTNGAGLTRARRISYLRGFAKFCQKFDSDAQVPPVGLLGSPSRRRIPHIYTEGELAQLLDATAILRPREGLRPLTYRALFGLLASSGLRATEAIRLARADVDLESGVLSVRDSKRHKSRFVPLHPSTVRALNAYAKQRDQRFPKSRSDAFFLLDNGEPPRGPHLGWTLRHLAKALQWRARGDYPLHRVRDFRHTFIVRSILRAFKTGQDFDRIVLALSTYVGHDHVSDTYWYVTGIPELMALVGRRFHRYAEVLP